MQVNKEGCFNCGLSRSVLRPARYRIYYFRTHGLPSKTLTIRSRASPADTIYRVPTKSPGAVFPSTPLGERIDAVVEQPLGLIETTETAR